MVAELNRTLEALQFAIQMEIDGKQYYLKISRKSRDEVGKKLLLGLAIAEDVHRQKFESIFETIQLKQAWPSIKLLPPAKGIRTIFAESLGQIKPGSKGTSTEIAALNKAIDMETRSYDYYKSQSKRYAHGVEIEFYGAVAAEEQVHHLVLLDYKEYLTNPAAWFVKSEHPSLDGA